MCGPAAALLLLTGTGVEAAGQRASAKLNERYAEIEQGRLLRASEDAEDRGRKDANRVRQQARRNQGTQRAQLAARGVAVDSGTALGLQEDTEYIGELDAATVLENSRREAEDLRFGAYGAGQQAKQYRTQKKLAPVGTILTGSANAAGSYYSIEAARRGD